MDPPQKRKRGRPPREDRSTVRSKRLAPVKLTESEWAEIKRTAEWAGVTVTELVRKVTLEIYPRLDRDRSKSIGEIFDVTEADFPEWARGVHPEGFSFLHLAALLIRREKAKKD